jgi:Novel STAND NTPase 1
MRDTPFRTSGRVTGEEFFGRTESIRLIVRHLRGKNNVAIVGAPRSGKTSLITILFRNYKRAEKDALTWFTDMRELTTLDDLVEEFYIGMGARTESHSLNALAKNLKTFQKRLVMFIDAAERFAEPPFNEEALFAVLSSYLQSQNISLCIATTLPPESVMRNRVGFPLHTQFIRCDLLPFTPDECYDLIQRKLQFTGIRFTDDEIDKLIAESKGNPAELQRLGAELFREKVALEEKGGAGIARAGRSTRKR